MKVKELIEELQKFDGDMEIFISDGHNFNFYHTNGALIKEFEGTVDIGVGGLMEE